MDEWRKYAVSHTLKNISYFRLNVMIWGKKNMFWKMDLCTFSIFKFTTKKLQNVNNIFRNKVYYKRKMANSASRSSAKEWLNHQLVDSEGKGTFVSSNFYFLFLWPVPGLGCFLHQKIIETNWTNHLSIKSIVT